ncbi:YggT family protein [Sphingomonas mesophila]|uniref:YggT family protein n=1 Tax=Sphingomonas mesophila TaxID=2303576 RepID=UPI000E5949FE|nr:YggT family protein [Sphingomonas mesophila]
MTTFIAILLFLLNVLGWLVIASAILSLLFAFNVLNHSNSGLRGIMDGLDRLLEPLYRPFRKVLPATGGIDWSPFLLLVTIGVLRIILTSVVAPV